MLVRMVIYCTLVTHSILFYVQSLIDYNSLPASIRIGNLIRAYRRLRKI